jgi:hypothetical protein
MSRRLRNTVARKGLFQFRPNSLRLARVAAGTQLLCCPRTHAQGDQGFYRLALADFLRPCSNLLFKCAHLEYQYDVILRNTQPFCVILRNYAMFQSNLTQVKMRYD